MPRSPTTSPSSRPRSRRKDLSEPEQKLYDMVTKRFLAIFYPAAEFLETTRITRVEGEPFKSAGKVMVKPGWLTVYGKEAQTDDTPSLAPVQPNETVKTSDVEVKQNVTKPPPRYTEATLLSAMEGAGKLVEDEELREAMREKGPGHAGHARRHHRRFDLREIRPPQRARVAGDGQGVFADGTAERPGHSRTDQAGADRRLGIQAAPDAAPAEKPRRVHVGDRRHDAAHRRARQEVRARHHSRRFRHAEDAVPEVRRRDPREIQEVPVLRKCDFAIWKTLCGRMFEIEEVEKLITEKQIGPLQGFRSKLGKPFAAVLKLNAGVQAGI